MAGFLDALTNLTPDQNQGLLAAATALLQAGGPSRTPVSFGQALGGGLQAFQQGINESELRRQQREQQALNNKFLGLKISDAESDLANQAAARERAKRLQDFYTQSSSPLTQMAAATGGNLSPTMENANKIQAAQQLSNAGAADLYSRRLDEAQRLRAAGFGPEADAAEAAAIKLREEFETKPQIGIDANGKPFQYLVGKGGSVKRLEGILPRDEMKLANLGGRDVAYNPYALTAGQEFRRSLTPGELLQAQTTMRGQDLTNARALEANKAGKLTEDQAKATGWLVQASQAYDNLKKSGFDQSGQLTEAARPGIGDVVASFPGLGGIGNALRSPQRQQFNQASSSLSEALLRAATGAGVNKDEAAQKVAELTPVWGEDAATTQQKFAAIPAYIETLRVRAGGGAEQAAKILSKNKLAPNTSGWSIQRVGE